MRGSVGPALFFSSRSTTTDEFEMSYTRDNVSSGEEAILGFGDAHRSQAFLVIIRRAVDPHAHGIEAHRAGVIGLQQFGDDLYIGTTRVEPDVVIIRAENDWHSFVDCRGHRVRSRGQNRAGLHPSPVCVLPPIP